MSKVEVNQISSQCGSTLTIGQSGDTVTLVYVQQVELLRPVEIVRFIHLLVQEHSQLIH
jgi:hypothetical protein